MSKMKHLLRKLHLSTTTTTTTDHNNNNHPRHRSPSPSPSTSSPPSVDSSDRPVESTAAVSVSDAGSGRGETEFNYFEEEFQLQLAMAISASADPETVIRDKDESDCQIKAAKQLSLACSPSVPDNERLSEFISLKYWNYNVVQYDEKVVDGFYDVYAIAANPVSQGAMPLLVDLQALSILENVEYEVVLVNRLVDSQLQHLENKVYAISVECKVLGDGLYMNGLIQKLADLVVDRMGGPVGDAGEIMKRWRQRSNQLRASRNSIVLPLGCLDVGLSRHRALLFKVLADKIQLPCMLVKGSLYTGTDEGAVNLIKFEDGSEYIIDLMGAPGTLIPSEVPSSLLLDTALQARGFSDSTAAVNNLNLVFDKVIGLEGTIPDIIAIADIQGSTFKETSPVSRPAKQEQEVAVRSDITERSEYAFEKPVRSEFSLFDSSPSAVEEASLAQEKKVKDVSKYVISAAKDPEFAQKLHAVLLESGASPPADLFVDMNPDIVGRKALVELVQPLGQGILYSGASFNANDYRSSYGTTLLSQSEVQLLNNCDNRRDQTLENSTGKQSQPEKNLVYSPRSVTEDAVLAITEGNRITTSGATGVASCSDMSHKLNEGASRMGITNEYCCVTAVDCSSGMTGHDEHKFQDSRGSEESSVKLIETAKRVCLPSCDGRIENLSPDSGGRVSHMLGEFSEWEIPWEDLHIGERIGIGSYGEVYRADWNGTEVAVKKFLVQDLTSDVLVQFHCEAEMMIRLRHPNVVLFMGAVTRSPNLSILTEFLPRGSLYRLLHRSGAQIDEKKRMKMALDVARGMNYLHTSHPTVVHRDLKSPNLLVDKNWVVKVGDFGLSRMKHHTFLSSNSTAGTPEWMAPEVLRNEPSNEKCDVYSFGVILWELATLCVPWTGLNPMQVVGAVGFQNRRLQIPDDVDPMVAQIIQDCWENDPRLRPSFSQLISRLKGLQRLVV